MTFEPIAVVGQACVLPGALSPEALWQAVLSGKDLLSQVPQNYWRLDPRLVLDVESPERVLSDRGGYVSGFDATFDASDYAVAEEQILGLDPLFHWLLRCSREALKDVSRTTLPDATGLIIGNLSYPSQALARLTETVLLDDIQGAGPDPVNRFMSGYPAQFVAMALGLNGRAFCLDAACASSLYAIKLACDQLHSGQADLMLAGGVNRADDLFIHTGFSVLQALSSSGRSRPFNRDADGLVPAEGAAILALKRLEDAEADGDAIAGVIRAVGLSNDGRSKGMLMPDKRGQVRAMHGAYAASGLSPTDISLIECHATGTAVGDGIEIQSMSTVFAKASQLSIGSLKSNLGHLITASGAAALIKVMAAMKAGVMPPTLYAEPTLDALAQSPFSLITEKQNWECDGPRRAAINNFGFGGNNAHLIVEQWQPPKTTRTREASSRRPSPPLAIVAIGACVGDGESTADFVRDLFSTETRPDGRMATSIKLPMTGLGFPPSDLTQALPQQLLLLRAAIEAATEVQNLSPERTGALVGMQCATEVARYGMRWRLPEWLAERLPIGSELSKEQLQKRQDEIIPTIKPAGVIGTMPNIIANRLNSAFNWQGPSYTVADEELSGITALRLAAGALARQELDVALVGAVDICCEPVNEHAAKEVLPSVFHQAGDGAVILALKRLADAKRDGDRVYATVSIAEGESTADIEPGFHLKLDQHTNPLGFRFGHAHAASGLQHVAAAALACGAHAKPLQRDGAALPWVSKDGVRSATVSVRSFAGQHARVQLTSSSETPAVNISHTMNRLRLYVYSGVDRSDVLAALARDGQAPTAQSTAAAARLVIICEPEQLQTHIAHARSLLIADPTTTNIALAENIYFREQPIGGEVAFMFTGAAAAYGGAGRALMLALPEWVDALRRRFGALGEFASIFLDRDEDNALTALEKLKSSSLLSQFHALVSREWLGLQPRAALGLSSGETNALYAFGVWDDMGEMFAEIEASQMYDRYLNGRCETARTFSQLDSDDPVEWSNWRILAPIAAIESALADEPLATITVINAPDDCVIGGSSDACARVVDRVGSTRAHPLGLDMVVHCKAMAPFAERWRAIHRRAVTLVADVRFYSNALSGHYQPEIDRTADVLLEQALNPIDFTRTVESAWNDGVRFFLEHGPRNSLSLSVDKILGARPHVAISLDRHDRADVAQVLHVAAALVASGHDVDHDAINQRLAACDSPQSIESSPSMQLRVPVHPPTPHALLAAISDPLEAVVTMAPAPMLAPVLESVASNIEMAGELPLNTTTSLTATPHTPHVDVRVRLLEEASVLHRAWLRQQSASQQRFLSVQQQVWQNIMTLNNNANGTASLRTLTDVPAVISTNAETDSRAMQFSREQLETLAGGTISSVFGPQFKSQDAYVRQVRMPEPPLLLADRVTHLVGEPGSMGRGRIRTETDVGDDAWYLQDGVMPPGIVIESGQADLLLISWLGADFVNKDERVYRLLGCELTFHEGGLPRAGDTLTFDIHIDDHARQGDVRLFFFHYDCHIGERLLLSVRHGQAGFFSDQDLAESGGVLWEAGNDAPVNRMTESLTHPSHATRHRQFSASQVQALADGDAYTCFGEGFERALSHQRTPRIGYDRLQMIGAVTNFDLAGGPWGYGYLRAESVVSADDWFFKGHFKNDPCMPGTLMANAAVQTMAFYLAACGYTLPRDGWRFEPVTDEAFKFVCRGQVTPDNSQITYELFVEDLVETPVPTLYAAILCTSDGLKVFHCRRFGLRLVPDYPLGSRQHLLSNELPHFLNADIRGDYDAILACTWGAPSFAFGSLYKAYDGARRIPRLPGPPFLFMSRVVSVEDPPFELRSGALLIAEYDVPTEAWYFDECGDASMPFAVLLEALLQPCGWFATYLGLGQDENDDLVFRNLDGKDVTMKQAIRPTSGTLRTCVTLDRWSKIGNTALVFFHVESEVAGQPVLSFDTAFGFFSEQALAVQSGLPAGVALFEDDSGGDAVDLSQRPSAFFDGSLRLPAPRLALLDEIVGYWPQGGDAGLGIIRGRQQIDPSAWYFKAHFFQDPVQPGSLGIETLFQLLKCYLIQRDCARAMSAPCFDPIPFGEDFSWTYRGQVLPSNTRVDAQIEVKRLEHDGAGVTAVADGSLWVDGLPIFDVRNIAIRIVDTELAEATAPHTSPQSVVLTDTRSAVSVMPDDDQIKHFWREVGGAKHSLAEHIFTSLARCFVGRVEVADNATLDCLRDGPVLYLANHQNGIESVLFVYLVSVIAGKPINAIAKSEHRDATWLGQLMQHIYAYPGVPDPELLFYFRWQDPSSMLPLLERIQESISKDRRSLLIHVEGGRGSSCRTPVSQMSAFVPELAIKLAVPIVPVRFIGGLPIEPLTELLEFPGGFSQQDIHIGKLVPYEALLSKTIPQQKALIAEHINAVYVAPANEEPNAPNEEFERRVVALEGRYGCHRSSAVVLAALDTMARDAPEVQHLFNRTNQSSESLPHFGWHADFLDWLHNEQDFKD